MSNNDSDFASSFLAGFFAARLRRRKKQELELKKKEQSISVVDELRKLGDLLKEGLITQVEFDNQKKKLLG